jgi:hypothetical protein
MKKIFTVVLLLLGINTFSQENWEAGGFIGASSYLGDINHVPYANPGPVIGFVGKKNLLNEIFYLSAQINYTFLWAKNDDSYELVYHDYEFRKDYLDFTVQLEYNFLPFIHNKIFHRRSFYMAIGLTYFSELNATVGNLAIPMTFGFKKEIDKSLVLTASATIKKSLTDDIDDVRNPNSTLFNNNDWYMFTGVSITYKFNIGDEENKCFESDPLKNYLINTFVID